MTVYQQMEEAGIETDSHHGDLYVPVTPETTAIVQAWEFAGNVTRFQSQIDGSPWYDIAFAYDPWWDSSMRKAAPQKRKRKIMTEQKHTPGPWTVGPDCHDGIRIETADGTCSLGTIWGEGREANARLIAEAPMMKAALAGLFEHCVMIHKHWGDGDNTKEANKAIEKAKAALAKVEGTPQ